MANSLIGRIVFGLSAVLFGVIALMWHDADTWQALSALWKLPSGLVIGEFLMVLLIAGGIGIVLMPLARYASVLLVVLFAIFTLTCVPSIVVHPRVFGAYDGFFEQLSLLSGAVALYAVVQADGLRSPVLVQAARIALGLSVVAFTLAQVFYFRNTVELVPAWIPPSQSFWAVLTTVAFGLAAIAILINVRARLAIGLLTLMLVLFGLLVWVPMLVAHSGVHGNWSEFALNFLIAGAAWCVGDALPLRTTRR